MITIGERVSRAAITDNSGDRRTLIFILSRTTMYYLDCILAEFYSLFNEKPR